MHIETKYSIGDTVYYAGVATITKKMDCPDCKGTHKWKAIAPSGAEYEFNCPRCSDRYVTRELSLKYQQYEPAIRALTIGSVRTDSNDKPEERNSYMCEETGVGGGTVYYEQDLWNTEERATVRAWEIANQRNKEPEIAERYNQALSVSAHDLRDLRSKMSRQELVDVRHKFADFVEQVSVAESIADVKKLVDEAEWG